MPITSRAKNIKLLILDVDGVLTDGTINISAQGELYKSFFVRDGLGIKMLQRHGIEVAILTGRSSEIVATRAKELGITHVLQGQRFKIPAYEALIKELHLSEAEVAYMGDDIPDWALLKRVGLSSAPCDANPDIKASVHWVSEFPGGRGAIRELSEFILKSQNVWAQLVDEVFFQGK